VHREGRTGVTFNSRPRSTALTQALVLIEQDLQKSLVLLLQRFSPAKQNHKTQTNKQKPQKTKTKNTNEQKPTTNNNNKSKDGAD
jgi:predicted ATPase